ncbi:MAG: hypothetical protein BGO43_04645 [Gammaproteobacteria bacterium 39-13]|nr:hypothetical protein [Gammaproteobacteria bacterium]OJV94961.1 MAG: hypothetical protein BGO43_04645 [Gammaproteobacteria bacterium 39-13]
MTLSKGTLLNACLQKQYQLAKSLYDQGERLSLQSALNLAANDVANIPILLNLSSDPDFKEEESIKLAVEQNNLEIIEYLNLLPTMSAKRIFDHAVIAKKWDIIEYLFLIGYHPLDFAEGERLSKEVAIGYINYLIFANKNKSLKILASLQDVLTQETIDELYFGQIKVPDFNLHLRISQKAKRTKELTTILQKETLLDEALIEYLKAGIYVDELFVEMFKANKKETIYQLLKLGIDVPEKKLGCTALLVTIKYGDHWLLGNLFSLGGNDLEKDINFIFPEDFEPFTDLNGETALSYALKVKKYDVALNILRIPGVKPLNESRIIEFLVRAIQQNDTDGFIFLINHMNASQYFYNEKTVKQISIDFGEDFLELLQKIGKLKKETSNNNVIAEIENVESILRKATQLQEAFACEWYRNDTKEISTMIFTKSEKKKMYKSPETGIIQVISNNDGYKNPNKNANDNLDVQRGEPLKVNGDSSSPIGYNIHFPTGDEIDNIVVNVYGGDGDSKEISYLPGDLGNLDHYLLQRGTVIITLNLPDLLKLTESQRNMPEEVHTEIHQAINKFYQTLKKEPQKLHPALASLNIQNKKIFLKGSSFGGRTAIRHSELYPQTFTGYISHDGSLSAEMIEMSDRLKRPMYKPWLDPVQEIDKIQEPLLLMQNRDDNNVNAKVTLGFYKLLEERNKSHLARVWITQAGNPIEDKKKSHNKGHFEPSTHEDFLHYADTVQTFLNEGPSCLPQITKWRVFKNDALANKFYKSSNLQARFIAEVLQDSLSSQEKLNLLKAFAGLTSLSKMSSDEIWQNHYQPLFYALHFIYNLTYEDAAIELQRIEKLGLPTDEMIKKSLLLQADMVSQFMTEFYGFEISPEAILNESMVKIFRKKLDSIREENNEVFYDPNHLKYILGSLYQANPELLEPFYPALNKKLQMEIPAVKEALKTTQLQQRKLLVQVWKKSAEQTLKNEWTRLVKEVKNAPTRDYLAKFTSLLELTEKVLKFKDNRAEVMATFDGLIFHFEKLEPKDELLYSHMVCAKLTHALLTKSQENINKAKQDSIELLIRAFYSGAPTKAQQEECSKKVNEYIDILKNTVSLSTSFSPSSKKK